MLFEYGSIVLLTLGIFVLDLLTPLGVTVWLLYGFPLALTLSSPRERDPLYFSVLASALIVIGYFLSPAGMAPMNALINRVLGLCLMWAFALAMVGRRKARAGLIAAEAGREQAVKDLTVAQAAREQANIAQQAAVEARTQAEATMRGAVTGRREVEEQLVVTKLSLEGIVRSAMDAIITVDGEQRVVLFNQAAEQMFECRAEQAIGQSLDRFIPQRFRDAHRRHIAAFGASGLTSRKMGALGTITGIRADGKEFPIEAAVSQVGVEGKKYFTVILRDISQRQRFEDVLKEKESSLRAAQAMAHLGNWNWDIRTGAEDWSDEQFRIFGYEPQAITPSYDAFINAVHADDRDRVLTAVNAALNLDHPYDTECRIVRPDGDVRVVHCRGEVFRDDTGRPLRLAGTILDVTEQKRAEEALRESERVHKTLLSNLSGMAYRCRNDKDWTMEFVSEGCSALTGYPPSDLINNRRLSFGELIHKDDREWVWDLCQRGLAEKRPCSSEYRIRTASGGEKWVWDQAQGVYTATGELLAIEGFITDITPRKQAEAALKEAQDRFQDIFESSKDAIGYASLDGKWVLVNEAFAKLTGYTREELLTEHCLEMTPDEYRPVQAQVIARVLQTGEPAEYEREYIRKDGSTVPVTLTVFMIKGDEGKPAGLAAIVKDITERKRAERLLKQSEQRYRRLVEVSPDVIFVNRGDRIVFINDQGVKLFGATKADQIIGRSPLDFIHPDYHGAAKERIHRLIEGSKTVPLIEEQCVRLDGTVVDVEVAAARFSDQEGVGILVVLRDISERKRIQEQLKRAERLAELGTLASGMAHEIGTPMNVIQGRAEYLIQRTNDEVIKKSLRTIVAQVERITRVMNQLLAFARRRPIERRAVDLKKTIEDNLEIFQERLARHGITVEKTFGDACPMAHVDQDQMSQILINLVMNAVHAMPDGGTLRVGLTHEDERVRLTVADTGHGIPPEHLSQIFDPFFTTKEFGKGTGLGLTVVKGILEEHGGSITVESQVGTGTTFTLHLPVHQPNS